MKPLLLLTVLLAVLVAPVHAQDPEDVPPPPEADIETVAPSGEDLRAEIATLKEQMAVIQRRLEELERRASGAPDSPPTLETPVPPPDEPAPPAEAVAPNEPAPPAEAAVTPPAPAGGRALLLPDISFIGTFNAHASTDRRDEDRDRLHLQALEMAIQSYVYPGVRADAFVVAEKEEDHNLAVEEAYLTAQNLGRGLSAQVGKRKVPFGRTNQLHPHSWLYITPPAVLRNFVSEESLAGEGGYLSYLLPTRGGLFAQVDLGLWSGASAHAHGDEEDAHDEPDGEADHVLSGPGASLEDRFQTLRLWTGMPVGGSGELELGLSGARGRGVPQALGSGAEFRPDITLAGVDLSYRRFGKGTQRLLLRGEYMTHRAKSDLYARTAQGWYALADYRLDRYREFGLRYDWSEFPFSPEFHESAVSGIYTNQLTEQTYLRLQLTHGNRPGKNPFNEAWLQWVWGVGPHTHNLE